MKFNSPEEQMKYEEMKRQKNEQKEREKKV
jgi:hypothetical protein